MKKIYRLLWTMLLILMSSRFTLAQVKYRVGLDSDKTTYHVYMTSTSSYTGSTGRISTAQVTLRVPHGTGNTQFTVAGLQGRPVGSESMIWSQNARVNAPTENPGIDYLSFGFSGSASPVLFDLLANQEIELFSFKNTGGCLGAVTLFDNETDPFRTPNSRNTNPGNQMTILGRGPGNAYEGNYGTGAACTTLVADLTASITGPSALTAGNSGTYVIQVANSGLGSTAGIIAVTTGLPNGLSYTGSSGADWSCTVGSPSGGTTPISCTTSAVLSVSASSSFNLSLVASSSLVAAQTLTLSGAVSGGGESNTSNNGFSQLISIQPAPVSGTADLSAGISGPVSLTPAVPGALTLTITNVGTGPYVGTTTTRTLLPAGLTYTSSAGTGWSCTTATQSNGQSVICVNSLSVAVGSALPGLLLSITGSNTSITPVQLSVSGSLTAASGDNPGNNSYTQLVTVLGQSTSPVSATADLSTSVSVSNQAPNQYDAVTARIVVTNSGPSTATGIVSSVTLPAGQPITSLSASGGTFNQATGLWTIGSLTAGQSVTLTVTLSAVTEGIAGVETEIIASGQYDPDSTPNNHVVGEDDLARACFSVPVDLCSGESFTASITGTFTTIQWYRNGQPIAQATTASLVINQEGTYTVTTNVNCPASGCCPLLVRIRPAGSCCQPVRCVPFVIKRTR